MLTKLRAVNFSGTIYSMDSARCLTLYVRELLLERVTPRGGGDAVAAVRTVHIPVVTAASRL